MSPVDAPVARLHVAHTADLDAALLAQVRALLDVVFVDDPLDEHDWEHALGGMHALLWEGEALVGHASVVQRRILHHGRALRTGYVEAVGVHPDRRRHGYGGLVMAPVERMIRAAYELGAVGATQLAKPFYAGRGWRAWEGPTSALTPAGVMRTEDCDDCVFVLPVDDGLDLQGELTCDWRNGDCW